MAERDAGFRELQRQAQKDLGQETLDTIDQLDRTNKARVAAENKNIDEQHGGAPPNEETLEEVARLRREELELRRTLEAQLEENPGGRRSLEKLGVEQERRGTTPGWKERGANLESLAADAWEKRNQTGSLVHEVPAGETAEGKKLTLEITEKGGELEAFVLDEEGNLVGKKLSFDPKKSGSWEDAAGKLAKQGIDGLSDAKKVVQAMQIAALVAFVWDAGKTINEMKNPQHTCKMLRDYARLVQKGDWEDFANKINEWSHDLEGPFHALGGYFEYLKALAGGLYLRELLGEPGSSRRQKLFERLRDGAEAACRAITQKPGHSYRAPSRVPYYAAAGAGALVLGLIAVAVLPPSEDSGGFKKLAGVPNCDCTNVDAGILTAAWRDDCIHSQNQLRALAKDGKLGLQATGGRLVAGAFCGTIAGPNAWPVEGGPLTPPAGVPDAERCKPKGLTQRCD